MAIGRPREYTETMDKWLREHYHELTLKELTRQFNDVFDTCKSEVALQRHSKRIGIKRKPKRLYELPIGTIRTGNGGRVYIKVKLTGCKGNATNKPFAKPYWKLLKDKVWEDAHGDIPKGCYVVTLNGDHADCRLENLALVTQRESALMAKANWWTNSTEHTKTGLLCTRLEELQRGARQ